MGLFDKLMNKTLPGVVEGVKDAVSGTVSQIAEGVGAHPGPTSGPGPSSAQAPGPQPTPTAPGVKSKEYFASILAREFSQYQVRESVPVAELGGQGKPYEFGLYREGVLKAVVVLVQHNRDRNRAYTGSKAAAEAAGVPFINFYVHMSNEYGYVVDRIRRLAKP